MQKDERTKANQKREDELDHIECVRQIINIVLFIIVGVLLVWFLKR